MTKNMRNHSEMLHDLLDKCARWRYLIHQATLNEDTGETEELLLPHILKDLDYVHHWMDTTIRDFRDELGYK